MTQQIHKYPRTQHIQGSRIQQGDEDLEQIPFSSITGRHLVVEEKMDGANCAVSFTAERALRLQSRGHYLLGGAREKHFALLKQWASTHSRSLWEKLGNRHVMYGEWLYAKHTVFYDALPHYFMEFDVLDVEKGEFLSTSRRAGLLDGVPTTSVRVLFEGELEKIEQLTGLIGPSNFITASHMDRLREQCRRHEIDQELTPAQTDPTALMEGLYIKVEEDGIVKERYKVVRAAFLQAVLQSDGHWLERPIIPNMLRDGVDIFGCRS